MRSTAQLLLDFQSNLQSARLVVARFVGLDIADFERYLLRTMTDGLRTFMDVQVSADAMARPMVVIESCLPKVLACKAIEPRARRTNREPRRRQRDVAFQYSGVGIFFSARQRPKRDGSSDVGSAV